MNEKKKTLYFIGGAILLALLAFATTPHRATPNDFLDQGEEFFPEFQDPNVATSLEVVSFNEETGEAVPFKVVFEDGKWSIPSHYNYPADGKDQLAKVAAGVIGIKKDDYRSDNVADHEALGVIDPLDESATSLTGRGTRVTISGENEKLLADFIIGKKVEGAKGYRFVRIPGQKRVYAAKMDIPLTTKFSDWIESDLLKVEKDAITQITLKDYSINERSGVVNQRDVVKLSKDGSAWKINKMRSNQEVNKSKADDLLKALDELTIVGIRPKPQGLSRNLRKAGDAMEVSQGDYLSLQSKGYFFAKDGQMLSNEGEMQVKTSDGVTYTLRFGEIAYGSGTEVSAGATDPEKVNKDVAENRYLFITTEFDGSEFKEPRQPKNTDFQNKSDSLWTDSDKQNKNLFDAHKAWEEKIEKGKNLSAELNDRFADWYYVISDASFKKLHLKRKDLVQPKKKS